MLPDRCSFTFGQHIEKGGCHMKRMMLRWSGFDIYADSIVRGLRADEAKTDEKFTFPAEFVSFDPDRKYVTFKVVVPETSLANIKALKPGEWITATSPHGALAKATPITAVRPFVISSGSSK